METIRFILAHPDLFLAEFLRDYGTLIYALTFAIIFCETGLVFTPFLPGDSLLFAIGALSAMPANGLHVEYFAVLLICAAIAGDQTNHWIGRFLGEKLLDKGFLIKRAHIQKTEQFYQKYGLATVFLGRFMPFVRTFVPFVSGIAKMRWSSFALVSATGSVVWIGLFLTLGFFFGNLPWVQKNFSLLIAGIIVFSILPTAYMWLKSKLSSKSGQKKTHSA